MLTVACVRTGTKYTVAHVERLRDAVAANMGPHRFVCLTDRPHDLRGIEAIDVSGFGLAKWWAKMVLFSPGFRGAGRWLYLDLDTGIAGPLGDLERYDGPFATCANFTRAAGVTTWPCRYGSCVMSFPEGWGAEVWRGFRADAQGWIDRAGRKGDQWAIEQLYPDAVLLQDVLPDGYFLHWRGFEAARTARPENCRLVIFAGNHTPETCDVGWINDLMRERAAA